MARGSRKSSGLCISIDDEDNGADNENMDGVLMLRALLVVVDDVGGNKCEGWYASVTSLSSTFINMVVVVVVVIVVNGFAAAAAPAGILVVVAAAVVAVFGVVTGH